MKLQITYLRLLCLVAILFSIGAKSQVTIGSKFPANSGSLLDLKENNNSGYNSTKGLLYSRVELEALNKLDPCVPADKLQSGDKDAHIGLMVYNVKNDPVIGLCPGLYVWDGLEWVRLPEPCEITLDPNLLNSPNSYIVAPNGGVSEEIPVGKPYLVWEARPDLLPLDMTAKVSVELLWQDVKQLIDKVELVGGDKGPLSKFKVTTSSTANEGNALVALHIGPKGDNTDPIYWSWHIWVTSYDPATTSFAHNNGEANYVFMDRNLGATSNSDSNVASMGLMYQWGRKDPFTSALTFYQNAAPKDLFNSQSNYINEQNEYDFAGVSGDGIKHELVPTGITSNLANSIKNPMTFYYGPYKQSYPPFDWFTPDDTGAGGDDTLWDNAGAKSPFDPCPKGWRVPAYSSEAKSPWAKFESSGWGGSSNVSVKGTGAGYGTGFSLDANTSSNITELGFYPYGFERIAREFNKPGAVGSGEKRVAGGLFTYSITLSDPLGYYWSAKAKNGQSSAMAEMINNSGFLGAEVSKTAQSRAMGAYVRCVKE